jgi:hypothetical protein
MKEVENCTTLFHNFSYALPKIGEMSNYYMISPEYLPHPMQLFSLGTTIVHSHTLPLQRPTTSVAFSLPQFLLREWGLC